MDILLEDLDHLEGALGESRDGLIEGLLVGVVFEYQVEVVRKLGMDPGILAILKFFIKSLNHSRSAVNVERGYLGA